IIAAGGPEYESAPVDPADGTSGGVPGGNIRNAFLYNPERETLTEVKSLTPAELGAAGVGDPAAFTDTRNPLLGRFEYRGREIIIINNHLSSRSGSSPIFGGPQPFFQAAEDAREAQTLALNQYVNNLIDTEDARNIIVHGDLNTFEFTNDLREILPGTGPDRILFNLVRTLRDDNVYSFIFDGNSQELDHMFVTKSLLEDAKFDIVHVNTDFPNIDDTVGSDHEPLVGSFEFKHKGR
ncbi:MAG TPA: endonuclease, partial [Thermodesulfobacteriota bacterium]|nr:endonuclease [Thermodesulfobacteriota bacterium]